MRGLRFNKMVIPIVLILHSLANIVYYKSWLFDWGTRQWACYFHCIQQGMIVIWIAVLHIRKRTYIDNQFLILTVLYNLFLIISYIYRQYTGCKTTSHLIGCAMSIMIIGFTIIRSGFKHKYFAR